MMAMLFAQKIILTDEVTFDDVPTKLRRRSRNSDMMECGVPELKFAPRRYYGDPAGK